MAFVPRSGLLSIETVPPCSSTIFLTMASPSPVPRALVVNRGSKALSIVSLSIPMPLSPTSIQTPLSVIEVEDNGIGMDEETAGQALEPLFTTRARGTGLGLAIVKKIVEEHGGTVSIESEPDRGTKAAVVIPLQAQRREPYGDE